MIPLAFSETVPQGVLEWDVVDREKILYQWWFMKRACMGTHKPCMQEIRMHDDAFVLRVPWHEPSSQSR